VREGHINMRSAAKLIPGGEAQTGSTPEGTERKNNDDVLDPTTLETTGERREGTRTAQEIVTPTSRGKLRVEIRLPLARHAASLTRPPALPRLGETSPAANSPPKRPCSNSQKCRSKWRSCRNSYEAMHHPEPAQLLALNRNAKAVHWVTPAPTLLRGHPLDAQKEPTVHTL